VKQSDKGAPAAAGRLEIHEAAAEQKVNAIGEQIEALRELVQPNSPDEEKKALNAQILDLERQHLAAYKLWFELSKQVRDYYKTVDSSKREGEKIPRSDVEEFFQQFNISIDLAIESYIISLSQDATRAESPEAFYLMHADNLRSCKVAAIQRAIQDKKLPSWAQVL